MARPYRVWSTSEIDYLIGNAGDKSLLEMAEELGRSEESIKQKLKHLGQNGKRVSLRSKSVTKICHLCGHARSKFTKAGICRVCSTKQLIAKYERDMREILPLLPEDKQKVYQETEKSFKSKRPVKVAMKHRKNLSEEDKRIIEEENFQLVYLTRVYNARKSRLRHMRAAYVDFMDEQKR